MMVIQGDIRENVENLLDSGLKTEQRDLLTDEI